MHGVILEHVSQIVYGAEVVDTYNLDVRTGLSSTEYETADTTETINTYFCCNFFINFLLDILRTIAYNKIII